MNALDEILAQGDAAAIVIIGFIAGVVLLLVSRVALRALWVLASLCWGVLCAGWAGRRERLANERATARATRPGPNWLAADLRRRRRGAQS